MTSAGDRSRLRPLAFFFIFSIIGVFSLKGREAFAEGQEKQKIPDKIEFVKTPDGREIIKITGQNTHQEEDPVLLETSTNRPGQAPAASNTGETSGRYCWLSLPQVRPSITSADPKGVKWYTLTTDNFSINIEENETFGIKTAEMLEGFNLLLREQMKFQNEKAKYKLNLKIFKSRLEYDAFCKEQQMSCDQTLGITLQQFLGQQNAQYGFFSENRIIFYWDKDWRKIWDEQRSTSIQQSFYETLFHEATHQLLNAYIPKVLPRWLGEGLAGYFENAHFDGKEIFLPLDIKNPFAGDMKKYLLSGRSATDVFSWSEKSGASEPAFYGFSASFITFLMRDARYRGCLDEIIMRLREGVPADKIFNVVLKNKNSNFWKAWILSYRKTIASGS